MTNLNIWYGSNENAEFSNLAERRFFHDDYWYETVEHAYQTLKSGEFDTRTYYRPWAPGKKFLGKRADRNTNIALMEKLITKSFTQNAYALNKLADIPQSQKITHHQDRGVWKTEFPRILEELRRRNYN
jgi:hypothetical protein